MTASPACMAIPPTRRAARRRQRPLPLGPGPTRLAAAFDRLGWHWWPSDSAVLTEARDGREACNLCGPCGVGCPRHARASADIAWWPRGARGGRGDCARRRACCAWSRGRVIYVRDGETARAARARGGDGGERPRHAAAAAASRRSAAGRTGRHLMHHPTAIVTGLFDERLDGHKGPFACALATARNSSRTIPRAASGAATRCRRCAAAGRCRPRSAATWRACPGGAGITRAFAATFGHSRQPDHHRRGPARSGEPRDAGRSRRPMRTGCRRRACTTGWTTTRAPCWRMASRAPSEALREAGAARRRRQPARSRRRGSISSAPRGWAMIRASSVVDAACRMHDAPDDRRSWMAASSRPRAR